MVFVSEERQGDETTETIDQPPPHNQEEDSLADVLRHEVSQVSINQQSLGDPPPLFNDGTTTLNITDGVNFRPPSSDDVLAFIGTDGQTASPTATIPPESNGEHASQFDQETGALFPGDTSDAGNACPRQRYRGTRDPG